MFPNTGMFTGDIEPGSAGNSVLDSISELIAALGAAATGVIGALKSPANGVVTVTTPPTATFGGFGGGFDLLTMALVGVAVYLIAKR